MKLQLHPLCTFFPRMDGSEFDALKADIKANGLRQRIVLHKGMILDGGNRYAACEAVGVPPLTVDYNGTDPVAFILSANLHRRHLTPGQQAAIVAAAADWSKAQRRGGDGSNQHGKKEQTGNLAPLLTVADRAAQSGASERTQKMADQVVKADPALGQRVAHGTTSLPKAVEELTGKRPGSKSKPIEPDDGHPDTGEVMDNLNAEILSLQAQVDALSAPDQAKELKKHVLLLQHAIREKDEQMDKGARLMKERDKLQRWQSEMVRVSGAGSPEKAVQWAKAMAATQRKVG